MHDYSYRLIISYEGTNYRGWQKNRELPTIEKALEDSLTGLQMTPFQLEAASRTDAGVHATGQVARLDTCKYLQSEKAALVGINSQLPADIRVMSLTLCKKSFHPTLDATKKTYTYHLCLGPSQHPCHRHFSWHIPYLLDVISMKQAAGLLTGRHNFQAFTNQKNNETYSCFYREIYRIDIQEIEPFRIKIVVQGNSFMYKMIRNLVGMLVQIGRGKLTLNDVTNILESRDRKMAPLTAPAHGLCLVHIDYTRKQTDEQTQ